MWPFTRKPEIRADTNPETGQIVSSDDLLTAISGALSGYEYVITTTTKPVSAGMQVRLAEDVQQ